MGEVKILILFRKEGLVEMLNVYFNCVVLLTTEN